MPSLLSPAFPILNLLTQGQVDKFHDAVSKAEPNVLASVPNLLILCAALSKDDALFYSSLENLSHFDAFEWQGCSTQDVEQLKTTSASLVPFFLISSI